MAKKFYIKERHNPQTGVYYVPQGQLTKKDAYHTNIIGRKTLERINHACFLGDVVRSLSFSPNLRKFIRKHPHFTHIYLDPKYGIWYIGYKDGNILAGAKFLAALCNGIRTSTFSYPTTITDRFEDRTQQFWKCTEYFGRRMFSRWY